LELALFILEEEFPTRNLAREFDLYGEMAREFNETHPATENDWMDIDEGGL
jgi:hypothetical protein